MGAPQPQLSNLKKRENRPVWVVLNFPEKPEPYEETWRGTKYVIPPNGKKQVIMKQLAARRFLHQPYIAAEALRLPNGQYTDVPKALKIVEMTKDEMIEHGYNPKDYKLAERDETTTLYCHLCGSLTASEKGLKIHMSKMHPEAQTVEDE
jgi:hypothetical protein